MCRVLVTRAIAETLSLIVVLVVRLNPILCALSFW